MNTKGMLNRLLTQAFWLALAVGLVLPFTAAGQTQPTQPVGPM
jgi:uncharacterized protein YhhL (DUF1145 family)